MTSLIGFSDELLGGMPSAAFLKFTAPLDCSMTNLGSSSVSDCTSMGSWRNCEYPTARSIFPNSSICGAEKPFGDAMRSLFKLTFPLNSDRRALPSVVVNLRESVLSFSTMVFRIASMPR